MEASYTESEQHLSVVGQDLEEMPSSLAQQYGDKAKRLDLSYNRIRYTCQLLPSAFFSSSRVAVCP
jgi:hypothetical protein